MRGWWCANLAFALLARPGAGGLVGFLVGWINPLLAVYFLLSTKEKFQKFLPLVAAAVVAGCIASWIWMVTIKPGPVTPLCGHYVWIAGIVLILAAPLLDSPHPAE